jgi:hypothetical protein
MEKGILEGKKYRPGMHFTVNVNGADRGAAVNPQEID